ncbi:hemoglobin [Hymenobacter sp. UYAg731]
MHKLQRSLVGACFLAASLFTTACSKSKDAPAPTPAPQESLFIRMGGAAGIEALTDQMVANVGAETGLASSVMLRTHLPMLNAVNGVNGAAPTDPTRLTRLRNSVVDQFSEITGGPLKYQGPGMLNVHTGMHITDAEYDAWRVLLDNALAKRNIPAKEKAEFTTLIDVMRRDVVGH